jgi:hypothetical protein
MDTIPIYIEALRRGYPRIDKIKLEDRFCGDNNVSELLDCLIICPNIVKTISLGLNFLTDKSGIKLAQYVASSTTIKKLYISGNLFSDTTFYALAAALCVNTSLCDIGMRENLSLDVHRINIAFICAMRLNPIHPVYSTWRVFSFTSENRRWKNLAQKSTPPSMLEFMLCVHYTTEIIKTKIH